MIPNILKNVSMGKYLNFGIGGTVSHFVRVTTSEEIAAAINFAKDNKLPVIILGGGNNTVFTDKRKRCLVLQIVGGDANRTGTRIVASAGVDLSRVIDLAIESGLAGIETLSGIPGTLGGAIYGNAGAYGRTIGEMIESVTVFDGEEEREVPAKECLFGYRDSIFKKKNWVILGAKLALLPGNSEELRRRSDEIKDIRWKKFGKDPKCPGSYFKNVPVSEVPEKYRHLLAEARVSDGKYPSGYLIELVGGKGMREGDVFVSDFHGNIILNGGGGKYSDLKKLVSRIRAAVKKKFGVFLKEEVIVIK